ncbi:MAG: M48 family metallopeptidase, partial [Ignavibacteriaceae bacterium]|nr:M48 family metallopeptidase [Ignavibacteriaceae bacterium]
MQNKFNFSPEYRSRAIRTIFAIIFFIIVYLVVLILSFALVASIFYSAILLLQLVKHNRWGIYIIFLFILIVFIAIILLVFILTFFFRKYTVDRSGWIEIFKDEQPKLFKIIDSISKEIGTNFPQKVYLGSGVEAMVFYDSNFRNLFFPSKENLMIGLGLVNSMSESELKAILTHEFGHFTQKSLNVYSYVYIENQIIYKMLIDEEFYQTLLHKFLVVGRFSWIVIYYSRIIRWILRKAYDVVSKSYMALSREMEFHADEISATVSGSIPAVTALLRTGLAWDSFNYVWQFYYNHLSDNIKAENLYPQHSFVMNQIAERYGVQFSKGLPQVKKETLARFNRSKLIIINQWASHPSVDDRIKKLEELNVDSKICGDSAWNFFTNKEDIQKEITAKLFRNWQFSESPANLTLEEFVQKYSDDLDKNSFNKKYSYFYDNRGISNFDVNIAIEKVDENNFNNFSEVYSEANVNFIYQFSGIDYDIKTIDSISKGEWKIESFEYDGIKYQIKESKQLLDKLLKQHESLYQKVNEIDIEIFKYFFRLSKLVGRDSELVKSYETYFYFVKEDKSNLQIYLDLINSMQFIYRINSFNQIRIKLEEMHCKESVFRERMEKLLDDENYQSILNAEQREKFTNYLEKEWTYFDGQNYNQEELKILEEAIYQFYELCSRAPFYALKKLLDFQIELVE